MSPSKFRITSICILLFLLSACSLTATESAAPDPTATSSEQVASVTLEGAPETEATKGEGEQIIITPTLAPTATPGPIDELVSEVAEQTGIDRKYFFGLSGEDWVNVLISLGFVLLGVIIAGRIVYFVLRKMAETTPSEYDDEFVRAIRHQIMWLVGIFSFQFATNRLVFLAAEFKQTLNQWYFTGYVVVISMMLMKLVDIAIEWSEVHFDQVIENESAALILPGVRRVARVAIIIVAATIILENFGIDITAFVAVLGIGGLALSLAAQDTLADTISGFIILFDRPFRVGDRIEIASLKTWGDVVEIGTRTTRIRTRDNRLVIVPNSSIGKSEVVNYTYPDPRYRVQVDIGIAYGSDLDQVRQVITEAVRQVEGVLPDKPVQVLFQAFGDSALEFQVRWWISSYADTRLMFDIVNSALYKALGEAGIEIPNITYDINIKKETPPEE